MTKDELKKAINDAGADFEPRMSKEQLENIYYKLFPHRREEPVTPVIPFHEPVQTPQTEPIHEPAEKPVPEVGTPADTPNEPEPVTPKIEPVTEPATEPAPAGSDAAFNELLGKIKTAEPPKSEKIPEKPLFDVSKQKTKKGKTSPDSMRIEGYILMIVIDTVFPASLSFINNMFDKRIKIETHELSLTPEQFAHLEPLADQAADYLEINLNPVVGFLLIATILYGNNLMSVRTAKTINK